MLHVAFSIEETSSGTPWIGKSLLVSSGGFEIYT